MKYTDEAINTVISDLVSQSGLANMIGLMLKQVLAERDDLQWQLTEWKKDAVDSIATLQEMMHERDEYEQELIAEQQACVDMWIQRDAALARVAQFETLIGVQRECLDRRLERIGGYLAHIELLEGALEPLIDPYNCYLDHNGNCQAHAFFGGECGMAVAKRALSQSPSEALQRSDD